MSLLDNIKDTDIRHNDYGRLSDQIHIEYVLPEEYLTIRKDPNYRLWFSVSLEDVEESDCVNLVDVLSTVHQIKKISTVYLIKSLYDVSVFIGIDFNVRSIRDAVKFIWIVSSAFWRSFRDVYRTVDVSWPSVNKKNFFRIEVKFESFFRTFKQFDASNYNKDLEQRHHNDKDCLFLYYMIRRPVTVKEARQMRRWCKIYNDHIVYVIHKKKQMDFSMKRTFT